MQKLYDIEAASICSTLGFVFYSSCFSKTRQVRVQATHLFPCYQILGNSKNLVSFKRKLWGIYDLVEVWFFWMLGVKFCEWSKSYLPVPDQFLAYLVSLGDLGFQIKSSMIGILSRLNLNINFGPIQNLSTKSYQIKLYFLIKINPFSIKFEQILIKRSKMLTLKSIIQSQFKYQESQI